MNVRELEERPCPGSHGDAEAEDALFFSFLNLVDGC
jgi:hypothetical protein